jgi:hypothetical protein
MAFTIKDYLELLELLAKNPEWKSELRRSLFSEEFLTMPALVGEQSDRQQRMEEQQQRMEEQQQRMEERQQRMEEELVALTAAQRRTDEHLAALTGLYRESQQRTDERLDRLEETVQHLTENVAALTEQMLKLTERVDALAIGQQRLVDKVGELQGDMLEMRYRDHVGPYFGRILRRPQLVDLSLHLDALEAALDSDEFDEVLLLDLVVSGTPRRISDAPEIWLAMEISYAVDENDLARAVRRANLLRKAGYQAIPAVAGKRATRGTAESIGAQRVIYFEDGRINFLEDAVSRWISGN